MSIGDTQLSITNTALIALGVEAVLSVSPPENKRAAILAAQLYDPTRRAILEGAPWNCAKKQARLTTVTVIEPVTGAASDGGLIQLTLGSTAQLNTGFMTTVTGVLGTAEANGEWVITVIDPTHIDLQNSAFVNAYISGGSTSTLVAPFFSYGSAYPLPADFIRFHDAVHADWLPWELMEIPGTGRCLFTSIGAPIDTTYIYDLQDPSLMEALLVQAIAYGLAAQLAIPLDRASMKGAMEAEKEARLGKAQSVSAQQRSVREMDIDVLLRSRF